MEFLVNPAVLIPRPETELLVETAIELVKNFSYLSIVDVGTGSGCIAVSLAKYLPQTTIWAIDLSEQALQTAGQNAARQQVQDRVTFLKGDLLSPLPESVDLIASNPPYVRGAELAAPFTTPEVYHYEPRLALDGGEDGLQTIARLLAQAGPKLRPGGSVLVEIGAAQGQAVAQLAQRYFPEAAVTVKPDLAGLDRLLVIQTQMEEKR
jgi:release factor glutamine methyltransferase